MPTYSEVSDMLVGDMPLPKGIRPQQYVDDATDEIDSHIGFIYVTPVDIWSDDTPVVRPARLLLKRIANQLASGRLIMAMSTGTQRTELHAYGSDLVRQALTALQQLAAGDVVLPGAPTVEDPDNPDTNFTGPQIANVDAESNVEAFYDRIANPYYSFGFERLTRNPDGMVA